MKIVTLSFLACYGAVLGSFLSVYIHRTCKNETKGTQENIFRPLRSYCPHCQNRIAWYDNMPIISYLCLSGKCRHCKHTIPWHYPALEACSAVIMALLYLFYIEARGNIPLFFIAIYFMYTMLAIAWIDIRVMIIPDGLSIGGAFIGLALSLLYPPLHTPIGGIFTNMSLVTQSFLASLVGILVGGGFLLAIATIGYFILKKEAMGGGDIKLFAMIGAFLGWKAIFLTLFLASIIGLVVTLFFIFCKKQQLADRIPFGPFIAIAACIVLCFQKPLLHALLTGSYWG